MADERQWKLTPGEYQATVEKISKINERAEKRGFTGWIMLHAERIVETRTEHGLEVTEVFYKVTLDGEAPKYNGWTFVATLTWDSEAGLVVRSAPGADPVDRTKLRERWCDHCQQARHRKDTYLVKHEDGREMQVGSTCLKDFLGWEGRVVLFFEDDISDEIDKLIGGGTYYDPSWTVDSVLAASWAAIQAYGYVPRGSYDGTPTRDVVLAILDPRSKADRKLADELAPYVVESYDKARMVREWVLSEEFKAHSDYAQNLKAIAGASFCTIRNVGFLASAPQAWAKAQERDLIRKRETEQIVNEFVGSVGDRIETEVKIQSVRYFEGQWGTTALFTMLGNDGHMFKWFASSDPYVDGKRLSDLAGTDVSLKIRGTIKKHEEYREMKSTVLTRCKIEE